jgi:hypothetical protein
MTEIKNDDLLTVSQLINQNLNQEEECCSISHLLLDFKTGNSDSYDFLIYPNVLLNNSKYYLIFSPLEIEKLSYEDRKEFKEVTDYGYYKLRISIYLDLKNLNFDIGSVSIMVNTNSREFRQDFKIAKDLEKSLRNRNFNLQ